VIDGKYSNKILQVFWVCKYILLMSFIIRHALDKDVENIKNLGNIIFGHGYLDNLMSENINGSPLSDVVCLVAIDNDRLIGAICFSIVERNLLAESLEDKSASAEKALCILLKLLFVDEHRREEGIASFLYKQLLDRISDADIDSIYASCWKESPSKAIVPFLIKHGWITLIVKENYWHEDSLLYGYQCVNCKNPCFCTAILMKRSIRS
jgi:predicted N-acetyltransferase YhbS